MPFVSGVVLCPVSFDLSDAEYERYAGLFESDDDDEEEEDEYDDYVSGWKETPDARVLQASLPGFKQEDITLEVKNYKVLTITGHKTQQKHGRDMQATFIRQIVLPEDVKAKEMSASVEDGMLIVKAPKYASLKPATRRLAITN